MESDEEEEVWMTEPLCGMYHWQMKEVNDINDIFFPSSLDYQFLEEAGLQDSTDAVIMARAAMDLSTRS